MPTEIRTQRDDDTAQVRDVLTAAFGDDGRVAALAAALRARPDTGAQLVAVDHGIVGHAGLSTGWLDAPERLVDVLVLSPLAVAPAHQRRGIGRALLDAAIGRAAQLGSPLLFLEGDPGYYGRLGWRGAGELGFIAPSSRIPPPAFQVVTLPDYDPATMTGRLVYNDTFWNLDCVGLRD